MSLMGVAEFGTLICEALGLESRYVRAIHIDIEAGGSALASVIVELYVRSGTALAMPLQTYRQRSELRLIEETEPVPV